MSKKTIPCSIGNPEYVIPLKEVIKLGNDNLKDGIKSLQKLIRKRYCKIFIDITEKEQRE